MEVLGELVDGGGAQVGVGDVVDASQGLFGVPGVADVAVGVSGVEEAPQSGAGSPIDFRHRATNSPIQNRPRPRSEPGPAPADSTCPSEGGSAPKSGPRTTEPTPLTAHSTPTARQSCHSRGSFQRGDLVGARAAVERVPCGAQLGRGSSQRASRRL